MRRVQNFPLCSLHVADFVKINNGLSRCVANQAAALELSRKSRRGNVAHGIGNHWLSYLDGGRWSLFEFVMNVKQCKDRELGEDFERRNRKIRTTMYLAQPCRYRNKQGYYRG